MSLYMFQASYTPQALKALVDKPQNREQAAHTVINAAGGKLVNLYFCFGTSDIVAIVDAPDDKATATRREALYPSRPTRQVRKSGYILVKASNEFGFGFMRVSDQLLNFGSGLQTSKVLTPKHYAPHPQDTVPKPKLISNRQPA